MDPRLSYRVMVTHHRNQNHDTFDECVATFSHHSQAQAMVYRLASEGRSAWIQERRS